MDYGGNTAIKREFNYPGIVLTTAHSSKGLEWPIVFNSITKYDEMYLRRDKNAMEEKRRLLFVSATRAKDELYITGQYTIKKNKNEIIFNQFLVDSYNAAGLEFDYSETEASLEKEEEKKKKALAMKIAA